ncbi:hypothetical protein Mesil_1909 [Allomeiothermus silvanus DSM 9946]|uniref:Uncharacterized protein n=1 Tax=Allomeiothermus silvanus (strain ATCC 700542 / DSM 9946 / NBRC 106475 / NCIMB 13440 / VI-R2) TaxID=526227 RepID=D7BGG8_ALLS1|nr:hypothetical protein [Allomeiothermus silvanus]ADH63784.1 hypothetical protein Mesil_1909 [Allomeiothermus silvanus DSM 9946]
MERLDRIEAQIGDLREELRGLRLAQTLTNRELHETLGVLRTVLEQVSRQSRPPRLQIWATIAIGLASFGLGFTAHWRISEIEEVRHVQFVLPPRAPVQNLQQSDSR